MGGWKKANRNQESSSNNMHLMQQDQVPISVLSEAAKEFKSRQCVGWVHCNT